MRPAPLLAALVAAGAALLSGCSGVLPDGGCRWSAAGPGTATILSVSDGSDPAYVWIELEFERGGERSERLWVTMSRGDWSEAGIAPGGRYPAVGALLVAGSCDPSSGMREVNGRPVS